MVKFEICSGKPEWSRFTDFYLEHRERIIPGYPVINALMDVKSYALHGRGAILTDDAGQVIGIGGFVLGLSEEKYSHKEIAVLANAYFLEEFQGNRTFVRGLQVLAEQIRDAGPEVKEVRLPTAAGNAYTNRLYGKIAKRFRSYDTPYGPFHEYSTSYDSFVSFCGRFDRQTHGKNHR
ncbi:hypothetical protein [Cohnella sp.]|uniref:hypothetical protein n=1 Tax=Cohnella sp. TaxID=1883426 RepID=UPI003568B16B